LKIFINYSELILKFASVIDKEIMKIIENWLRASDGQTIFYNEFLPADNKVKFVVQIFHGMAEHSERYTDFAEYLVSKGAAVYASDHRGHGRNCMKPGQYGVWPKKDTWHSIVDDLKVLNDIAEKAFPGVPIFVLGHSMGSFLARTFITKYSCDINGVILTGTGTNPSWLLYVARFIACFQCTVRGVSKPALLLDNFLLAALVKDTKLLISGLHVIKKLLKIILTIRIAVECFHALFIEAFSMDCYTTTKLIMPERLPRNSHFSSFQEQATQLGILQKAFSKQQSFIAKLVFVK
jgi:pimeloyl-ACP methyl ester carboxylesterase